MNTFFRKLWPTSEEGRGIWIGLLSTIILGVAAAVWGWWTQQLCNILHVIGSHVSIPVWIFIPLLASAFFLFLQIYRSHRTPDYVRLYREDTIDNIRWTWSYNWHHEVISLVPLCAKCQTELKLTVVLSSMYSPSKTETYCPTCNSGFWIDGTEHLIEDITLPKIRQRIRTGNWKQTRSIT